MKVSNEVWNKLFPPKKGDRVRVKTGISLFKEGFHTDQDGILEVILHSVPSKWETYGIRLDSNKLIWVKRKEIEKIGKV